MPKGACVQNKEQDTAKQKGQCQVLVTAAAVEYNIPRDR
jgi:hypothetical protein